MVARRVPAGGRQRVAWGDARTRTPGGGAGRRARTPASHRPSDYRFVDRLDYMLNGKGFTYDRVPHLWLVDVATGAASRLTDGPVADREPAWSPDGRRIAFSSNRRRDPDLFGRQDIHVVDVETRGVTSDHPWPEVGLRLAGLAAGRGHDRRPRSPPGGPRRQPQRHLAVRRRRLRRDADGRAQPVRPARPDAGIDDEQRRHGRGRPAARRRRPTAAGSSSAPRSTAPTSCGGSPSTTAGSSG